MSLVSLVKFDDQNMSMQQAVENSLNLINYKAEKTVQKITIKPNMCYYWDYSTGETTDPRFVGAIIDVLRNIFSDDVEISLVESDASAMKCKYAFRILGYEKLAKEKNVKLINLANDQVEPVDVTVGSEKFQFSLPKTIQGADLFVNVPKIKFMTGVKFSCALKNIYGCNPYVLKYQYHKRLHSTIVGLNKVMKPDLTIVDGIRVTGVTSLKLGLVMASADPLAVDVVTSKIMDIDPNSVNYLKMAHEEKIGTFDYTTKGESLDYFKNLFPSKKLKDKAKDIIAKIYTKYLV